MKKVFIILFCLCFAFSSFGINCFAVSAKAAVMLNGDTGDILYSKNETQRLSMASTTKIMTALLLCENKDLNDTVTVPKEAVMVEGTSMGLKAGDTVSCRDLLYGMLLSSGNDAANTAAFAVSGSIKDFALLMNKKAKELNLNNTNFVTPSGLDAENHYTTALDLGLLTLYAMKNEDFKAAAATDKITLTYGNDKTEHTLINHHRLVKEEADVIGVKTGFTKKSGRCLVTAAKKDGKYLIVVTLNDKNDWQDHKQMLNTGFSLLSNTVKSEQTVRYIPLLCGGYAKVKIPEYSICTDDKQNISFKISLPEYLLYIPKKDENLGYLYCYNGYKTVNAVALKAEKTVEEKETGRASKILSLIKLFLMS